MFIEEQLYKSIINSATKLLQPGLDELDDDMQDQLSICVKACCIFAARVIDTTSIKNQAAFEICTNSRSRAVYKAIMLLITRA